MGFSQVKKLQNCCFIVSNQNASFRQAKKIHFFLFFASLNLSTCLFIQLKLMEQLQCQNFKNSSIFLFSSKNGQNGSCEVGFDILPLQALILPPLVLEEDLLPTQAEVYDISQPKSFRCFDVALPNQHFNNIMMILQILMKK